MECIKPSPNFSATLISIKNRTAASVVVHGSSRSSTVYAAKPAIPIKPRPVLVPVQQQPTTTNRTPQPISEAKKKVEYLESLGIDSYDAFEKNPQIADPKTTAQSMQEVVQFLQEGFGLEEQDMAKLVGLYPQIITSSVKLQLASVCSFLLREAEIPFSDMRSVIHRRPPLLVCCVQDQLRPTLWFLRKIGINSFKRDAFLLSCDVESQLVPHILYFEKELGFRRKEALQMFVRLPTLFCYSIDGNIAPKSRYLVGDMARRVREIKDFPQFFAFSLDKRIRPRHVFLWEKGVRIPLSRMLIPSDNDFYMKWNDRLKDLCCRSLSNANCESRPL